MTSPSLAVSLLDLFGGQVALGKQAARQTRAKRRFAWISSSLTDLGVAARVGVGRRDRGRVAAIGTHSWRVGTIAAGAVG